MGTSTPNLQLFKPDPVADLVDAAADLNANFDKIEAAVGAAWTLYNPTWTSAGTVPVLGNGTLTGRFLRTGKTIRYVYKLKMGSTTTYGNSAFIFSLPSSPNPALYEVEECIGYAMIGSASLGRRAFNAILQSAGGGMLLFDSAGNVCTFNTFAWSAGALITIRGTYEEA